MCFNVKVAGGCGEQLLYGLSFLASGGLFLYTAPSILDSLGETSLLVDNVLLSDQENVQYPGVLQCLRAEYKNSIQKIDSRSGGCTEQWELEMITYGDNWQNCPVGEIRPDIVEQFISDTDNLCHVWNPGSSQVYRFFQQFRVEGLTGDRNFERNDGNGLYFYDPTAPVNQGGVSYSPIATTTEVKIQIVKNVDENGDVTGWDYEPVTNSVQIFTGELPDYSFSRVTIEFARLLRVQTRKSKSAWEVWAELGGAWGGAILVLGVCFIGKSVPGKTKTSPNTEVQVWRFRGVKNRKQLLTELAGTLQNAEEVLEENDVPILELGKAA